MNAPETLWDVRAVARFTGMSERWVRQQAAAPVGPERIPLIRLGGRLRFDPEQVRAWALRGVSPVDPNRRS